MGEKLSDSQLREVKEAFSLFDMDGNGRVATKDLGSLVRSLGLNPSEVEVRQMAREADTDGTGKIVYSEFVAMFTRHVNNVSTVEEIVDAFRVFDKEGNGYISAAELRHVMLNLGEKLHEEEVNDMIREADISGDGHINYQEFAKVLLAK
ncbi:neo-calmodulin-like [Mizuhopecten yessoensis]|uniref:Sulfhydryl light chain n=1 Tax=Mizuhopecten yessoensis TaxID=6573 RepID=A0A210QE28_MIZYE|nr:neo-calmodulin-like [Mizuhopecten yessoensis]XP_021360449.1 neo-calmodulin-like [Mizuhopecten yessoensis]XP_021360450.1 neo-calmodulin-like [Mizuhopecten yessoensis]OWF46995.1 Calmodulin [Mizuhopecten yessoensis]